jgi:hypothetical protein
MRKLTLSTKTFGEIILDLIKSGVTFDAVERDGFIIITFSGGF